METFCKINLLYESQYEVLDQKDEQKNYDTTPIRLRLCQNHIRDLIDCFIELYQRTKQSDEKKASIEQSNKELNDKVVNLETELADADKVIVTLKNEITNLCEATKTVDHELGEVNKTLEDSEADRKRMEIQLKNMEDLLCKYKDEINQMVEDNDKCKEEMLTMNKEIRDSRVKLSELRACNKDLDEQVKNLDHCLEIYKTTLANEEALRCEKEKMIQGLAGDLDTANSRMIHWQVKALAGDEAAKELASLNKQMLRLAPKIEKVCSNNEKLKSVNTCLVDQLDSAEKETECLRQKLYAVALECAELDQKLTLLVDNPIRGDIHLPPQGDYLPYQQYSPYQHSQYSTQSNGRKPKKSPDIRKVASIKKLANTAKKNTQKSIKKKRLSIVSPRSSKVSLVRSPSRSSGIRTPPRKHTGHK